MAQPAFKYTNEALAFITLYKAMPPEIKKEVKEIMINETEDEAAAMFTNLSLQSWDAEEEAQNESKVWEQFYNNQANV